MSRIALVMGSNAALQPLALYGEDRSVRCPQ
jgi:hypothetical protein